MVMIILNGSDPVDVAYVIIIAVREFMNNHTGDQADENFVNFMPSVCEMLLSKKGNEAMEKATVKVVDDHDSSRN